MPHHYHHQREVKDQGDRGRGQQYYELAQAGDLPVSLAEMKECLRLPPGSNPEDDFITLLLEASTLAVEKAMHGRQIRANQFFLFLDLFCPRIPIRKIPVSVTAVERLVSDVLTPVATTVYYQKNHTQFAEVILREDQEWPEDQDDVEHAIRVSFTAAADPRALSLAKTAIKRHVAFMYENRGDCDPSDAENSLVRSGAQSLLALAGIKLV